MMDALSLSAKWEQSKSVWNLHFFNGPHGAICKNPLVFAEICG